MTPQKQIAALAELDGWTVTSSGNMIHFSKHSVGSCSGTNRDVAVVAHLAKVPNYLDSYDAIIPLIRLTLSAEDFRTKFQPVLSDLTFIKSQIEHTKAYFLATPSQLCEALLRATGKWRDE